MNTNDINHLQWLYWRMATKHNEETRVDYMIQFKEIIDKLRSEFKPLEESYEMKLDKIIKNMPPPPTPKPILPPSKTISFSLSPNQLDKLKKWQEKIKSKYGSYGKYTFKFTPGGIADFVEVKCSWKKKPLDLTDWENI